MDLLSIEDLCLLIHTAQVRDRLPSQLLVGDLRNSDRVHNHGVRCQLLDFELHFGAHLVKHHFLRQETRVGQGQDIGKWAQAKRLLVALVGEVVECAATNTDVLALTQPAILSVIHLTVPEFVCVINHAHLTLILIQHKQLNYFDLDVEIVERGWVLGGWHAH